MSKIKLLFFATLRDRAGTRSAQMEVPAGTTVHGLKELVQQEYPNLRDPLKSVLIAVNREYAEEDFVLPEGAEVAFFPPVSGG